MDSKDKQILAMLSTNPRIAYRELALQLGASIPAIHRRVEVLREKGILGRHNASISLQHLGAVSVHIVGRSVASSMDEVVKLLSRNDSVRTALIASGNVIFIHAELRNIDALDGFSEFAKRTAILAYARVNDAYNRVFEYEPAIASKSD